MLQYYEGYLEGLKCIKQVIDRHVEYYEKVVQDANQKLMEESQENNDA